MSVTVATDADDTVRPSEVTVRVPGLLARFTDDGPTVDVRASTVAAAVDALLETYPALRPHLLDDRGSLRTHLQLVHEGTAVAWDEAAGVDLVAGDEVRVLQAVSGG